MSTDKTVLTDEELQKVNDLRNEAQQLFLKLGQVRIEKRNRLAELEKLEEELINKHDELLERERKVISEINEKYGEGELNPTTGEFISKGDALGVGE